MEVAEAMLLCGGSNTRTLRCQSKTAVDAGGERVSVTMGSVWNLNEEIVHNLLGICELEGTCSVPSVL